jgi:hypothetical protein
MTAMRNPDAKHKDFGALIGLIPSNPKVLPSDIDMVYERNGYFLFGEWKRSGEYVSYGQRILLKNLAAQPKTIVLLIIGDTDDGMRIEELHRFCSDGTTEYIGEGVNRLKEIILDWYEFVNEKR